MNALPFLPYGRQSIDDADIKAVVEALQSEYLTTGPRVAAFEQALATQLDVAEAVVCANGTAALHLAYAGLGLGEGDAVVVPAITFLATANAARHAGAEVVFADVDPDTGRMTAQTFEQALRRAEHPIEAVAPVHLAGAPVEMEAIRAIAQRHGIKVIEDACHALGSRFGGGNRARHKIGDCAFSDAACFSFHPVKTIAMGEGGAVTTNDPALARRMRQMRHHGMTADPDAFAYPEHGFDPRGEPLSWYSEMAEVGFNYRATDLQCALGLSQLGKLAQFAEKRRLLHDRYVEKLGHLGPQVRMVEAAPGSEPCWHLALALIDFDGIGIDRARLMAELRHRGVGTQVHYFPVSHQPYYQRRYGTADLPGAWRYYQRCLSLPLYPALEMSDIDRVADALADIIGGI